MNGAVAHDVRPAPTPRRRVEEVAIVVLVVAFAVSTFVLMARFGDHLSGPSKVHAVRIENPSNLLIDVDVRGDSKEGWLPISIIRPNTITATEDVVDQGDVWYFKFDVAGVPGGQVRVTDNQLEQANWTITIPDEVIQRLERAVVQRRRPGRSEP